MATQDSKTWSDWRWANYYYFMEQLGGKSRRTLRLLDLGAGEGQFNRLFNQFDKKVAADFIDNENIDVVCDLTKGLPFSDESFDIITLSNTIEHIPDLPKFLGECARVLAPGGMIVGTVPFLKDGHQEPYDFNRPTRFEIKRLLDGAGLTDIEVKTLGEIFDLYFSMTHGVMQELVRQRPHYRWVRKAQHVMNKLVQNATREIPAPDNFTEGYGFTAHKS